MAEAVVADAVVSGLVNVILENLSNLVAQEFGIAWGLKKELEKLESMLTTIQAVLQDAEKKQVQSEALRNWLRKLKDVAYDADDIFEEFATKALQQRVDTGKNAMRVVNNFFSLSNPCLFSLNMGHKIKKIGERLDMIAAERSKFHLREVVEDMQHETGQRLQTDSLVKESEIYGRVQEKEKIVDLMLTDARDKMDVSVIPIVGMGGLGKTTLAQLAYNDERVVKHFELRMWVCVSEDFDIKRLVKAILKSAHADASDLTELDHLQCCLQETLRAKRFLLVLDDVWNEDQDVWDALRKSLGCGGKGSTIIVTTRIETAAWIMGTLPIQYLTCLSEDDSWCLFKHQAFYDGREENEKLTAIGKEIVKKCGGVPLAAKALGGLMRFKTKESEWLFVKESEIWELPQKKNGIIPALRLSYKHLPSHLKRCFTYCCLFPKDSIIEKEEVILQWMANGFVLSNQRKELEDIGHEYFNELLWRSFFQDVEKDEDGNIIMCKMHNLVHDLARSVAEDEYGIMETYKVENVARRTRHISCNIFKSANESQTLRTILLKDSSPIWDLKGLGILLRFSCLRVLDLSCGWIKELPPSISNLIHLRYLNLSNNGIKKLPESICSLKNLQTLKLRDTRLSNLPKGLKNMCSLRHLDISNLPKGLKNMSSLRYLSALYLEITEMPKRIGKLTHLQTLPIFIVGKNSGRHIGELKNLINLRGRLEISNLELVRNEADAKEANLISKQNLHELILSWQECGTSSNIDKEEVSEGLQPHPNIKRLSINGFGGIRLPTWLQDSKFSNLVDVFLYSCKRCEYLPSFGLLPSLEKLSIRDMDALKYIGRDFYGNNNNMMGFPKLKELEFWDMPDLEEWSGVEGTDIFPCLQNLFINNCPKLLTLPYFPSLENLDIHIMDALKYIGCDFYGYNSNMKGFPSLKELRFWYMPNLEEWLGVDGTDMFPCLQNLVMEGCPKLRTLPYFSSLKHLKLIECSSAVLIQVANLTSLSSLNLERIDDLVVLPEGMLSHLTLLNSLEVVRCQKLRAVSEELDNLIALKKLRFCSCWALESLPKGPTNLSSLEELEFSDCRSLISLPEDMVAGLTGLQYLCIKNCRELTPLPDSLQSLPSLRSIFIYNCPKVDLPTYLHHLSEDFLGISNASTMERYFNMYPDLEPSDISHIIGVKINMLELRRFAEEALESSQQI